MHRTVRHWDNNAWITNLKNHSASANGPLALSRDASSSAAGSKHLEPKVMDVLVCLAEQPGQVVERNTLFEKVWGDRGVLGRAAVAMRL